MTDRFESLVDKQIREAIERGEFDNLPGAGKPIPGAGRPDDELWWVRQKLREEGLSMPLPPSLALRKDAEQALAEARRARSENEIREILTEINDRIRTAIRNGISGPPLNLMPYDIDEVISEWRAL